MEGFVKYVVGEWTVIQQAPGTFGMAILVIAILAYQAARYHLKERIQLRDDQIADYKRKLDGATPDEAKARIDQLEAKLSGLISDMAPRTLTEEQSLAITRSIAGSAFPIAVGMDMAAPEGKTLVSKLTRAFESGGWQARNPSIMGVYQAPSGLFVAVDNAAALSEPETRVINALRAAGLAFDIRQQPNPPGTPTLLCVTGKPTPVG